MAIIYTLSKNTDVESHLQSMAASMKRISNSSYHDARSLHVEEFQRNRFGVNAVIDQLFTLVMKGRKIPCAEWQEATLTSSVNLPFAVVYDDVDAVSRLGVGVCDVVADDGTKLLVIVVEIIRNTGANMSYSVSHVLK